MEKFNIAEFEANKKAGEYNRTLDDGTQINQFGNSSGYFEKAIPPKGWFYSYKEFYGNGNLKTKGMAFKKGDYQSGVWIQCDSNGIKTGETNHDAPFKLSIDSVIKILAEEGIRFSLTDPYHAITRGVVNSKAVWLVEWKVALNRVETLEIDDSTGKVVKKSFYKLEEDH